MLIERDERFRKALLSVKKWPSKKGFEFLDEINRLLENSELGHEWQIPFIVLILQGWLFPPTRNMDMKRTGKENKGRVQLTINPDTSIEDIKGAWADVKRYQVKLWPKFQKTNFTKKSFKNIGIFWKDMETRFLDNTGRDLSTWETYTKKDMDIVSVAWPNEEDISIEADRKRRANLRQIRHRRSKRR